MADNVTVESVSIEFKGTVENFQSSNDQLISILEKLDGALKNATKSMSTFNDSTKKTGENIKSIKDTGKSASSSALKLAGLGASAAIAKRKVYELMTASADFVSTQLRFNSTFSETNEGLQEAQQFVEDYSNALYLNEEEVMNAMATYKLLTRNMGISNEASSKMSKNLTQLSYDLAAFTNTDVNQIVTDLRSGVSGQAEAMQKYGVSLNQATLQSTLYANGIDRTVASLNSAERAELMYYQIMTATAGMQGYYAKSFMTPAVALSTVKNQFRALAREIGNVFIPILMALTPLIVAVTQILRQLAQTIANFLGIDIKFDSVSQKIGAVTGGIDGIGDSADKTKKKVRNMLRDFDELHVVDFGDDSSSGAGTGTGTGGIGTGGLGLDPGDYAEYDGLLDGFNEKVEKIKETIRNLLPLLLTIAGIFAISKIVKLVDTLRVLWHLIEKHPFAAFLTSILLVASGAYYLYNGLTSIMNGTAGLKEWIEILGGTLLVFAGTTIALKVISVLLKLNWSFVTCASKAALLTGAIALGIIAFNKIKGILDGSHNSLTDYAIAIGSIVGTIILLGKAFGILTISMLPVAIIIGGIIGIIALFNDGLHRSAEEAKGAAIVLGLLGVVLLGIAIVTGSISLTIVGIIALVAGIILLIGVLTGHLDDMKNGVDKATGAITEKFKGVSESISGASDTTSNYKDLLNGDMSDALNDSGLDFENYGQDIMGAMSTLSEYTGKTVDEISNLLGIDMAKALEDSSKNMTDYSGDVQKAMQTISEATGLSVEDISQKLGIDLKTSLDNSDTDAKNYQGSVSKTMDTFKMDTNQKIDDTSKNMVDKLGSSSSKAQEHIEQLKTKGLDNTNKLNQGINSDMNGVKTSTDNASNGVNNLKDNLSNMSGTQIETPEFNWFETAKGITGTILKLLSISGIPGANFGLSVSKVIHSFATGGFPEQGELFIANEAGPELVGSMGNRSVVANNKQIIAGIAQASYDGMKRALQEVGMNEGDTFVYVGGKQISDVVTKKQKSDNRRYGR